MNLIRDRALYIYIRLHRNHKTARANQFVRLNTDHTHAATASPRSRRWHHWHNCTVSNGTLFAATHVADLLALSIIATFATPTNNYETKYTHTTPESQRFSALMRKQHCITSVVWLLMWVREKQIYPHTYKHYLTITTHIVIAIASGSHHPRPLAFDSLGYDQGSQFPATFWESDSGNREHFDFLVFAQFNIWALKNYCYQWIYFFIICN